MTITLVLPQPPAYSETFFNAKIKGLQESGYHVILVTAATELSYKACRHLQHPRLSKSLPLQVCKMLIVFVSLLPYLNNVIRHIQLEQKEGTGLKRILEKLYINATLLKLKTDWLHFGFATMALEREVVAKAIGAKMAVSLRGYDVAVYPLKHPKCYHKLWKYVDKVHSISKYLLEKAIDLGMPINLPYEIIYPAVDFTKLSELATDTKKHDGKLRLLTIARLHWIKGIDDLVEAATFLKQKQIDFEWNIIGDLEANETDRYLYHVFQRGLQKEVLLLGKKNHSQTLQLLNEADVYVQTSLNEGFCNATLEAQALGKLCVANNAGALNENIVHKETGFVVPRLQLDLLTDKIIEVINLEDSCKEKIRNNAMQRVKKEFTLNKQKQKLKKFYSLNK